MQTVYWNPGEPNSYLGKEEDCAFLDYGMYGQTGRWHDGPCTTMRNGFVCEIGKNIKD